MPKRSIAAPPGARKAVVGRWTLAAQATVAEPASERVPAAHRCTGGLGADDCCGVRFVPPHPATTSAASVTATTQFLNIPHPVISVRRTSYYIEDIVTGRYRLIRLPHRHRAVNTHVVVQRSGIPYELERTVCSSCARVLNERTLRRTAA